jgi:uncharacterized protein DUF4214/methyltransferase family protein
MFRFIRRVAARLQPILQSDTAFIEAAYREILGRDADQDGLNHYRRVLREGLSRSAVLLSLMRSEEFTNKLTKSETTHQVSLRSIRPDRYRDTLDRTNGQTIGVFDAKDPSDFDWLESAILEYGYYEHPGVWNFGVDVDKRVIAEIVAAFTPSRALEIGCAAGAVLDCLGDLGVAAEGIEISSMAIDRASARVRARIHQGDLLSLDLPSAYDMVFGLDVFEHLNPNKIAEYLQRVANITRPDAYLFCSSTNSVLRLDDDRAEALAEWPSSLNDSYRDDFRAGADPAGGRAISSGDGTRWCCAGAKVPLVSDDRRRIARRLRSQDYGFVFAWIAV